MQDDNHQDFFEFEENFREFLEGQHPPPPRPQRQGRLFVVLGICAVIIAALATVFGIFRSDDSTLRKDLRKTFPIQSPPPVSRPVMETPKSRPIEKNAEIEPAQDKAIAEPTPQAVSKTRATALPTENDGTGEKAAASQDEQISAAPLATAPKKMPHKSVNPEVPAVQLEKKQAAIPEKQTVRLAPALPARKKPLGKKRELPDLRPAIRQGRLQHAALAYRQYFEDRPAKYSISLEVACLPKTVMRAFAEVDPAGQMFILPTKIGDRSCFAVLWGNYGSLREARAGKSSVPTFFTSQTSPRIVALSRYLGSN